MLYTPPKKAATGRLASRAGKRVSAGSPVLLRTDEAFQAYLACTLGHRFARAEGQAIYALKKDPRKNLNIIFSPQAFNPPNAEGPGRIYSFGKR